MTRLTIDMETGVVDTEGKDNITEERETKDRVIELDMADLIDIQDHKEWESRGGEDGESFRRVDQALEGFVLAAIPELVFTDFEQAQQAGLLSRSSTNSSP